MPTGINVLMSMERLWQDAFTIATTTVIAKTNVFLNSKGVLQTAPARLVEWAGPQKRADSYFPPEERVRLVRLVSNWVLPGERSGESSVEYSWNKL